MSTTVILGSIANAAHVVIPDNDALSVAPFNNEAILLSTSLSDTTVIGDDFTMSVMMGIEGPVGPKGADGLDAPAAEDIPSLSLLFENSLI